jgi:hypothetical protein
MSILLLTLVFSCIASGQRAEVRTHAKHTSTPPTVKLEITRFGTLHNEIHTHIEGYTHSNLTLKRLDCERKEKHTHVPLISNELERLLQVKGKERNNSPGTYCSKGFFPMYLIGME